MPRGKLTNLIRVCMELAKAYPILISKKHGKKPTRQNLFYWIKDNFEEDLIGWTKLHYIKTFFDKQFSNPIYKPLVAWEGELPWDNSEDIPLLIQLCAMNKHPEMQPELLCTPAIAKWVLRLSKFLPEMDLLYRNNDDNEHPILILARSYALREMVSEFIGRDKVSMADIDIFLGYKPWLSETRYNKYEETIEANFEDPAAIEALKIAEKIIHLIRLELDDYKITEERLFRPHWEFIGE